MSAPMMRRSFSLHFNGGSTRVEADCTASRTLAELLADSLFSQFPQFASLRAASASVRNGSRDLEQEMARYYVCKARASTLTLSKPLPTASTASRLRSRRSDTSTALHVSGDELVEVPLSTATPIAPCDLFIIAMSELEDVGAGVESTGSGGAGSGSSNTRRRHSSVEKSSPPTGGGRGRRGGRRTKADSATRPRRKYIRRAKGASTGSTHNVDDEDLANDGASICSSDVEDSGSASGSGSASSSVEDSGSGGSNQGSSASVSDDEGDNDDDRGSSDGSDVSDDASVSGSGSTEEGEGGSESEKGSSSSASGGESHSGESAGSGTISGTSTGRRGRRGGGGGSSSTRCKSRVRSPARTTRGGRGRRRESSNGGGSKGASASASSATATPVLSTVGADGVRVKRKYTRRVPVGRDAGGTPSKGKAAAAATAISGRRQGQRSEIAPARTRGRAAAAEKAAVAAAIPAQRQQSCAAATAAAAAVATFSPSGSPLLFTPDGQPIKRKRGRPPKNAPRYPPVSPDGTILGVGVASPTMPSLGAAGTGTGTSTRGSSALPSSDPIPLPPRRKRHRTKSPGPSVVDGLDSLRASKEGRSKGRLNSDSGIGSADGVVGVALSAPAGAGGLEMSLSDAQQRVLELQRVRMANTAAAAAGSHDTPAPGVSSSMAGSAAGSSGIVETGGKSDARVVAAAEAFRVPQQPVLVHFHEYTADSSASASESIDTLASAEEDNVTVGQLLRDSSALSSAKVTGVGSSVALDGTCCAGNLLHDLFVKHSSREDINPLNVTLSGTDAGTSKLSVSSCAARLFSVPKLLHNVSSGLATTSTRDSASLSATARIEKQSLSILLSHPQAAQALPEISLYAGLATAYEHSILSSAIATAAAVPSTKKGDHTVKLSGRATLAATCAKVCETAWRDVKLTTSSSSSSASRHQAVKDEPAGVEVGGAGSALTTITRSSRVNLTPSMLLTEEELHALARSSALRLPPPFAAGGGIVCSRVSVTVPIIVGGCVRLVNAESRERSHQWTVYVRGLFNGHPPRSHGNAVTVKEEASDGNGGGAAENEYLSRFVDHVTFILDRSFTPCVRTVHKPPFELTEVGWGEFVVSIHVHLRQPGFTSHSRLAKRVLRCYLSGSGGRAPLVASTGPGRGASGLDPVTSMSVTSSGGARGGANSAGAAGASAAGGIGSSDTNVLVESFLDVNFNSAARSLYYRGPFLPSHLVAFQGGSPGGSTSEDREDVASEGEDSNADNVESGVEELIRLYIQDRNEENQSETRPRGWVTDTEENEEEDDIDQGNASCRVTPAPVQSDAGDHHISRSITLFKEEPSTATGTDDGGDSLLSSSLQSPTSSMSSSPNFGGSLFPSASMQRRRGPRPRRRPGRSASASQTLAGGDATNGGGGSNVLRAGHAGNVVVLSHLLRFSHRPLPPILIPPKGDARAPRTFEPLGYTLVSEPVVTESYDEIVVPLNTLTDGGRIARRYRRVLALLERETAVVTQLATDCGATVKVEMSRTEGHTGAEEQRLDMRATHHTKEQLAALRAAEERTDVLRGLLLELTRCVRSDRRWLRAAALLEARLRDAVQTYLLSHARDQQPGPSYHNHSHLHGAAASAAEAYSALPPSSFAFPSQSYMSQLYFGSASDSTRTSFSTLASPPPSSPTCRVVGSNGTEESCERGGVSCWPYILRHGGAAEKDVQLALAYLGSIAATAQEEKWLDLASLQARCRCFPGLPLSPSGTSAHAGVDEGGWKGEEATEGRCGMANMEGSEYRGKSRRTWDRLLRQLPSSALPLTSVEFDLAVAARNVALQHSVLARGALRESALAAAHVRFFADVLLPHATEIDAAVLHILQRDHSCTCSAKTGTEVIAENGDTLTIDVPRYPLYTEALPPPPPPSSSTCSPPSGSLSAAALTAVSRSRGLLGEPHDGSASFATSPSSGTAATATFASGEQRGHYGEAADVENLLSMRRALIGAINDMRIEASRRQAALTLRQV